MANPGYTVLRPRVADIEADRSGGNVTLMQFVRMLSQRPNVALDRIQLP